MRSAVANEAPDRATIREWLGLAVLALPTLVVAVNLTVLLLGLPRLTADIGAGPVQALWITDIYGFCVAGFLITMGVLGDRTGQRRLLLFGAAAFGLASVAAAYATGPEALIAARALMGIAAATLMPTSLSLIRVMFADPRQRTIAIAAWMTTMSLGLAIGPLLGGAVLRYFWWGSIFLINVPLLILLLLVGRWLLPEYRAPRTGRPDVASVALSLGAVLALVYALKDLTQHGLSWTVALATVAGAAAAAVFVRRQRRIAHPLIDPQLFRGAVPFALIMIALALFAFGGTQFLLSGYLQQVAGLSPWWAGVWMAPSAMALFAGSLLAPLLLRWMSPARALSGALFLGAAGFALLVPLAFLPEASVSVWAFMLVQAGVAVAFLALGPPTVLGADIVIGSAPPAKAGAASALEETAAEFGVAIGVAVLGSLSAAVYRSRMADTAAGLPAADPAGESLTGALAAPAAPEVLAQAREAFVHGFALTGGISAAVMALLAAASVVLLREKASGGAPVDSGAS